MGPWIWLIVALVALVLFFIIGSLLKSTHRHALNKEEYQTRWLKIENSLSRSNPQSFPLAVLEGDKLLDRALQELGVAGKTMGERLKHMDNGRFSDLNGVWAAHKVRNQLAHEAGLEISYEVAHRALSSFRRALKDIGAI